MKLIYLSPSGLFDDWARPVQIMKMCEAFSKNGVEVELVVPKRKNKKEEENPFVYLNVSETFKIKSLPIIDLSYGNPSKFYFVLRWVSFLMVSKMYLLFKKYDALYTREPYYQLFFRNIYLESHKLPHRINSIYKFIFKNLKGIIVLTSAMKSKIISLGVSPDRILVSHDAVRVEDFLNTISKSESRKKFNFPDKKIYGYVGTLKTFNMEKGVSDAISALEFLKEEYILCVVGGDPVDVDFYKEMVKNKGLDNRVIFTGRVLQKNIPEYISACDVVVAPFPKNEHYEYYMSPLKIFEYMASKRPMVVTNLVSLREVLRDKETALFIEPNNPKQLASAVEELVNNPDLAEKISQNAYLDMEQNYTWNKRAENIIEFIKK